IMVANGGLGNGVSREKLYLLFSGFGTIQDIQMKPKRSYSILNFDDVNDAQIVFNKFNKFCAIKDESEKDVHLCLAFIEKMPYLEDSNAMHYPQGLEIVNDFVSENEEKMFLDYCDWGEEDSISLKNRRVRHFGYEFNYKEKTISKLNGLLNRIPQFCCDLLKKLKQLNYVTEDFDQLTVNQYNPGKGIPNHVDTPEVFEKEIAIISLGSSIVMDFKHPDGTHVPIVLPRFSVAILKNESRYIWSHGIAPRLYDLIKSETGLTLARRSTRISFTFRKIKTKLLGNFLFTNVMKFPKLNCVAITVDNDKLAQVYNTIAPHFSRTRHSPWPSVVNFLNRLDPYAIVLDVGCGNGKYLNTRKSDLFMIGCDASPTLCQIGSSVGEVQICNVVALPYPDCTFDACICIAVLHHLASQERRSLAIKEIVRVLKVGGQALIYVWAMEQDFAGVKSKYLKSVKKITELTEFHKVDDNLSLPVHNSKTTFKYCDNLVPWTLQTEYPTKDDLNSVEVYKRYYHVFCKGELVELCRQFDSSLIVSNVFYEEGNWCVEIIKTNKIETILL
ncbi:hypothetical protein HELRODRAFT_69129, partial [Helobdella robusta]|uniref:tRNA (carboxymethyluridine(34)-5-O)-methyltransferase n=1 Tax=Helobdella robusta TaxID=6412 RepID=T1FZQ0_HELRO